MSQGELFTAVSAVLCVVHAVLGVLWWARDRADRAVVARLDAADIDPYHAVATTDRDPGRDADRAGAAELLLAGLIRVKDDGQVAVTAAGAAPDMTPEHPVPAAVLTTLRGHAAPWALNWLYLDAEHRARRDAFLRAEDARWPRWATRSRDRVKPAAILVTVLFAGWCSGQLLYVRGAFSGPGGEVAAAVFVGLLMWGVFALVLGLVVLAVWPWRRDRFSAYCRSLPPHPAEAALDDEGRDRLHRAMTYSPPRTEVVEDLSWDPGAF
ncbi:hypothetical protein [Streptomyces fructofermentans]|uniref:hypothetical protein n=1 Tax=Streptomyces fructofermentans TaxID=152141 RepID=UPI0033C023F1